MKLHSLFVTFAFAATLFAESKVKPSLTTLTTKPDPISGQTSTAIVTKESAMHWMSITCSEEKKLVVQFGESTFGASLGRSLTKSRLQTSLEDGTGNPALKYGV